jgi:hypothetical protein
MQSLPDTEVEMAAKQVTTVINVKKAHLKEHGYNSLEEWLAADRQKHVYIGRNMAHYVPGAVQSKWANPFPVKKYGREGCLEEYRKYILASPELLEDLPSLKGKTLGCWCHPEACHGDILIELINQLEETDDQKVKGE